MYYQKPNDELIESIHDENFCFCHRNLNLKKKLYC